MAELEPIIETAWERRDSITPKTKGEIRKAVDQALALLDKGEARVAEKKNGQMGHSSMAQESGAAVLPA